MNGALDLISTDFILFVYMYIRFACRWHFISTVSTAESTLDTVQGPNEPVEQDAAR